MSDDLQQRLTAAFTETLVETNAQTVSENLGNLRARFAVHRRRWIWELLQNAADATSTVLRKNRVSIRVEPGKLIFRHNGSPFSLKQITHLIYHGSTKQDDEGMGGKFGTGFLAIHLVAPKVRVLGILEDGDTCRHFDFELDRNGDTAAIQQNMQDARASLERSLCVGRGNREFSTEFVCHLDSDGQKVVESGLAELERDIPFVLAAVSEFDEINLELLSSEISWSRSGTVQRSPLLTVVDIERLEGKRSADESAAHRESVRVALVGDCDDGVAIAVRLRCSNERWQLTLHDTTPRLFYPFPLVDSQDLALPFVVFSKQFQPREERDGIRASADGTTDEQTQRNWALLGKIPELFEILVFLAAEERWLDAHRLLRIRLPAVGKWLDQERFVTDVLCKLLNFVRGGRSPSIVATLDGTQRPPRDVLSPARDVDGRIYALAQRVIELRDRLPAVSVVSEWSAIGEGWEPIAGKGLEEMDETLTSEKLAVRIGSCANLDDLARLLCEPTTEYALSWLNDLLVSVPPDALQKFASNHRVLPSQRDELRKEGELHLDGGIDKRIKDICEKLQCDVRPLLLHSEMSQPVRELFAARLGRTLSNDDCIDRARKALREVQIDANDAAFIEAGAALLAWLIEGKFNEKLAGFPVFCVEARSELREDSPLLVPTALWDKGAQEFESLFGPARRLHNRYGEILREEHWTYLGERGVVYRSLFVRENLEGFNPRQIDGDLTEDLDHAPAQEATVAQIAFFQEKGGVLDQVRGSKAKGKELLRFLLKYVITASAAETAGCDILCSCQNNTYHRVLPAWLIQLKTREWVYLARGKADPPTAENIAPLLDDELTKEIQNPNSRMFFSKLGIGVTELLLLRAPRERREQLDQIFGQICASPDASTLASIETILDDPNIRAAVLEKKKTRDKVRKNQRLGAAVERLLKQELEGAGIRVTRTGRGSDFEVESDFLDNEQEQLIELKSEAGGYLLEIKSTTSEFVRMTLRQGQEATTSDGYTLCVVDISAGEPDEQMVRNTSHFLCDIGARVGSKVRDALDLKIREQQLQQDAGEVSIAIEAGSVRLRIGAALWRNTAHAIPFGEFIERVKRRDR